MTRVRTTPEFSRLVDAPAIVAAGGTREHLVPKESERQALAARLGLVGLNALEAMLDVRVWRVGGLEVSGTLKALIVQTCVVSLEPFESAIEVPVHAQYLPQAMLPRESLAAETQLADAFAPEPPEVLPDSGRVDLGELVTQHLAVAIDPYPRRAGVTFDAPRGEAMSARESPFAKLAALVRPPKP
jgi:hypothetical protein